MFKKFSFIFIFFFIFDNCAPKKFIKAENVEELFQRANELMDKKKYDQAIKYFTKIINEYPQTNYLIKSQFLLAECYFLKGDYAQAKLEYEFYTQNFPYAENYETALYRLLLSDLKTLKKTKNLTSLEELKEKFLEFQTNFPDNQFVNEIKSHLLTIDSLIAQSFFDIALLYYKNDELIAAKIYFEYVKDNFSETPFKWSSLYFLAHIHYRNNEKEKAKEYLQEIIEKGDKQLKEKAEKLLSQWKK
jgi:outer membrane assembly lipoprotein YfiO